MDTWNGLDYILVAIIVVSVLTAMMKGFVQELISLASVVIGLVVAAVGYSRVAACFEDMTKSHEIALGVAFLALFVGTLLVGAIVGALARKLIKTAGIQGFDRVLGGLFGLVRGVLVDAILLMALVAFAIKPDVVRRSVLVPYVTTGTRLIAAVMPGSLRAQFRAGFERFREELLPRDSKSAKP